MSPLFAMALVGTIMLRQAKRFLVIYTFIVIACLPMPGFVILATALLN